MKKTFISIILLVALLLGGQIPTPKKQETTSSFFDLYDQNRKEQIPNYITLDFILTANYLFKQQSVTALEKEVLYGKFKKLAYGLKANLLNGYTPQKKEALAFVLVLNELLGNRSVGVDPQALALAKKELKLIASHQGIVVSPIAKVKLDYSQYKVRGKYTQSSELKSYFLALKYMSYMPFMVNAYPATGVSQKIADEQMINADFIATALKPLMSEYQSIENILHKLSGKGDDLSLVNLLESEASAPNKARLKPSVPNIRKYLNGLKRFPKISERIIDTSKIKKQDIPKASLALKLLPSRFTPDSYIFSQLTYPNVGVLQGKPNRLSSRIDGKMVRGYPTIMDLSAVLVGNSPIEQNYQGYRQQVAKLKSIVPSLDSIYGYDFFIYHKLLKQNKINSFKGYYTQSRYIMNLYQKQSYTGGLKSIFIDERKKAYLEKNIGEVLDLLIAEDRLLPNSKGFIAILQELKRLDKKHNLFTPNEVSYLNNLDSKFKSVLQDKDSKIRVDIHTNPVESRVMYEVLREPFIKMVGKERGAFYNHIEIIKER